MAKVHCADFASEMLLWHWEEIDATLCHTQGQEFQFFSKRYSNHDKSSFWADETLAVGKAIHS